MEMKSARASGVIEAIKVLSDKVEKFHCLPDTSIKKLEAAE
jgi:hypothetical protein